MTVTVTLNEETLSYEKEVAIVDDNGKSVEEISFENTYKEPEKVVEPTKAAPGEVKPIVTKTGDSGISTVAVFLILLSAITLILVLRKRAIK